jgi:hypothetical protein
MLLAGAGGASRLEGAVFEGSGCGGEHGEFWQEIYDQAGILVEVHQKFPVDEGHRKV